MKRKGTFIFRRKGSLFRRLIPALLLFAVFFQAEARGEGSASPAAIRILYNPVLGKESTLARFKALTDHLSNSLALPVQAVSFDQYEEMLVPLARGEFEIAYLTPMVYVEAEEISRLEVLVMELDSAGNRGYHSVIICREDRPFQNVPAARGALMAFTNPDSTSGFLVPLMYFLRDLKTSPQLFARQVVFAGDHHAVIRGVYNRQYDLGATNDVDLARTLQADSLDPASFRLLWRSQLIPGPPVCLRPDLPAGLKEVIRKSFLDFNHNAEGMRQLQIGGYAPAAAAEYKVIRDLSALDNS